MAAFDVLAAYGISATHLSVAPGVHGKVKDVRFKPVEGKGWPFAFIPNRDDLLFFVRPLGVRTLRVTQRKLQGLLPEVQEGGKGRELRIRVRTETDAQDVIVRILDKWPGSERPAPDERAGIPEGITRRDVLQAVARIDAGKAGDQFGESINWDVVVDGVLLPPARVIGVAARRVAGRELEPDDFAADDESTCQRILEELGFEIVPKGDHRAAREMMEARAVKAIRQRTDIGATRKQSLVSARRGQGVYRANLEQIEQACRITGVLDRRHLRASHIKPWCECDDFEKLDGHNGLLLSPHVDHLFDQGYISFSDEGDLLLSPWLNRTVLERWGIAERVPSRSFRAEQKAYLAWHREHVFGREAVGRRAARVETVGNGENS